MVKDTSKINLCQIGYEESAELMNNLIKLRDNIYVNNAQNLKKIFEFERNFMDKFQTKSRYMTFYKYLKFLFKDNMQQVKENTSVQSSSISVGKRLIIRQKITVDLLMKFTRKFCFHKKLSMRKQVHYKILRKIKTHF